ncbi:copper oxidase [Beijerinckiaceae bacterium]|nr:copper oxidase [Beijerinckiaceae bacterium]
MLSRRSFVSLALASGATTFARAGTTDSAPTILRIERRTLEVNGKAASVFGLQQPDGSFGITTEVGKPFRVHLENHIDRPSLIHWHGLTPPWEEDGVAGVSAASIPPGGSADYDFQLPFGGTFWMHSHYGLQEQSLMSAPLIIHDASDKADQQEVVMMLADFSFTPPEQIFEQLRKGGALARAHIHHMAMSAEEMAAMPQMAAPPTESKPDLNDVKYDAFLANDRTLADPQIVKVEQGGHVRLRVINGSSMSNYHIDLGPLDGDLIAVDGLPIVPVRGRIFPIAVAQRLDIMLTFPQPAGAYPILAKLEGERQQTGIILRAGAAEVTKIPETAEAATPPLTLDLESRLQAATPLKPRMPNLRYTLNLTGSMEGYQWSINDVVWSPDAPPLGLVKGDRVELILVNRTNMPHPMHLHGHPFQVVAIGGNRFAGALRDTMLVPAKTTVAIAFDANNPGLWAFHCHLLYHMEAGMFTTFRYS